MKQKKQQRQEVLLLPKLQGSMRSRHKILQLIKQYCRSYQYVVLSSDRIITLTGYFGFMYRGELEVQAKRKALAVLQDEITKILNSSRDLSTLTTSLIKGDEMNTHQCLERMTKTEEEVENLCRNITRDVAEIGSLMANREDILRSAYIIDDIAGYISGVAFRLANMKPMTIKKASFDSDLNQLVGMVVDTIFKLNEMGRALSINPPNAIDIARDVQTLERQVDVKHRAVIVKALNEISSTKDLLLLKDAVEGIEDMVDKCQEASDSFTILALSM